MTAFPGLVRHVAAEAERRLREGLDLLSRLRWDRTRPAELKRLLDAYGERIRRLEETLAGQDTELRALRADLASLVSQLNDRLLPRIDERMDDTERDLTAIATTLIRQDQNTTGNRSRLEAVEQRVGELRGRLARMEQRAGLWRELQANLARLGEDIDTLRSRVAPISKPVGDSLNGSEARP
jgi:chromosome segregation ATPase